MSTTTTKPNDTDLNTIVQPLIDLLNELYPIPNEELEISMLREHWVEEQRDREDAVIVIWDPFVSSRNTVRAVATLLSRTGSTSVWNGQEERETDPMRKPLRFRITRNTIWYDGHFQVNRYLIADYVNDDADVAAAERQVALIVEFLRDRNNLIELGAEDLEAF